MTIETFLVTLDSGALNAAIDDRKSFDIIAAVKDIPSLHVVEGDPSYSVIVTIDSGHVDALRQAIGDFCIIGRDATFDLY
jgi:hypothetical protein